MHKKATAIVHLLRVLPSLLSHTEHNGLAGNWQQRNHQRFSGNIEVDNTARSINKLYWQIKKQFRAL